jgi:general secretion pathway protein G
MRIKNRQAFTMIELVFVIVIIGVLSSIAIPKFAANRADAEIAKAKSVVSAVRNAISSERQKRILRGDFNDIFRLTGSNAAGAAIFDYFDNNATLTILDYPPYACAASTDTACWRETTQGAAGTNGVYTYNMPVSGTAVFTLSNNHFDCPATDANCKRLTR